MRRAVLVVNPISGSARRRGAVERFVRCARDGGVDVAVAPTAAAGDGARIARDAAREDVPFVVAAGGDGTVNEVARGLLDVAGTRSALALLPLGTSNLVARHLRVPLRPDGAADALVHGSTTPFDTAEANGRPFVACAGVGLDAYVVEALTRRRRGHIGFHSYAAPVLQAARGYDARAMHVRAADGREASGSLTLVLNTRPYAAFFEPAPGASTRDGLLDVVVLRGGGTLRLARWAAAALRGRLLRDADAVHLRTPAVRIDADDALPWQIDGDVGGRTPLDILVRPAALRIVRPAAPGREEPA